MISLCGTLLPNDKARAIQVDIGKLMKAKPVIHKVIKVDFAPIRKIVSTVSKLVLRLF